MKRTRFNIIALVMMLFVLAVTPACEAFWQALQEPTTQTDETKTDQSETSKGKQSSTNNQ